MPRKIRKSKRREIVRGVQDWQLCYLSYGKFPTMQRFEKVGIRVLMATKAEVEEWWHLYKEKVFALWVQYHPMSFPWAWWEFEAPRWGKFLPTISLPEPRLKLQGSGGCAFDLYKGAAPNHSFGCYQIWKIDKNDPPVFESEEDYAKRHQLKMHE